MVGMALLTAYKNSGGEIDLKKALTEMNSRGKAVPGGACGFWAPAALESVQECFSLLLRAPRLWERIISDFPIR